MCSRYPSAISPAVPRDIPVRPIAHGPWLLSTARSACCRLSRRATAFTDPVSPWQNGYSESFNGRFRDEFLTTEQFDTLLEAQVLAEDWRIEYNTYRPHGSPADRTPEACKRQGTETQPDHTEPLDPKPGPPRGHAAWAGTGTAHFAWMFRAAPRRSVRQGRSKYLFMADSVAGFAFSIMRLSD